MPKMAQCKMTIFSQLVGGSKVFCFYMLFVLFICTCKRLLTTKCLLLYFSISLEIYSFTAKTIGQ